MTTRPVTKDVILDYLRADSEPRHVFAIIRYMETMHMTTRGATRLQLYRLCKAGVVTRTPPHWYALAGV